MDAGVMSRAGWSRRAKFAFDALCDTAHIRRSRRENKNPGRAGGRGFG